MKQNKKRLKLWEHNLFKKLKLLLRNRLQSNRLRSKLMLKLLTLKNQNRIMQKFKIKSKNQANFI